MMLPTPHDGRRAIARRAAPTLLGAGIFVVASVALLDGAAPERLAAQGTGNMIADSDGDGLPDRQEKVLGTDPVLPDTDFDGTNDGEEIALQTEPTLFWDQPEDQGLSIGMSARGEGGKLLLFIAVHADDAKLSDKILRVGVLASREIMQLDLGRMEHLITSASRPTPSGGILYTLDVEIPEAFLHIHKEATFFAAVGQMGEKRYSAAAKADLAIEDGVVMLRRDLPGAGGGPGAPAQPGSVIFYPIPPDGDPAIPVDWEAGKICYQITEVVGVVGNLVLHQVIQAECEEGWDTYCESDCPATVGSTYQTVDPGSILGG